MEAKPKSCYKCGQEGHIVRVFFRAGEFELIYFQSRDCTEAAAAAAPTSTRAATECYKCGKTGHIARNCTESASTGGFAAFNAGNTQKSWYV